VFWTQATWSSDRNTVSNMPGAELGLRLYQITHDRSYLDWALRMYRWTNTYLQRSDGLYWDHLDLQGNVEQTIWSYNQGVPVGVNVLLYEVTHQRPYLAEAERIAAASYQYFVAQGRLDSQPPYFNSIYFKNLLLLESVTGGSTYHQAMSAYADRMWRTHRDASSGLFHFAAGDPHTQMIEQAAMTQIYAVLAWRRADYARLY
jgi:rhamnogalacturonyl hydrolase YesR